MVKCEWHNYPIHGCDRAAKHFCRSLVKDREGLSPAHRAFCDECFDRIHKQRSLLIGGIADLEEVSYEEWKVLRGVSDD
jgi:hypothetical protein